jgi:hypothetical protein
MPTQNGGFSSSTHLGLGRVPRPLAALGAAAPARRRVALEHLLLEAVKVRNAALLLQALEQVRALGRRKRKGRGEKKVLEQRGFTSPVRFGALIPLRRPRPLSPLSQLHIALLAKQEIGFPSIKVYRIKAKRKTAPHLVHDVGGDHRQRGEEEAAERPHHVVGLGDREGHLQRGHETDGPFGWLFYHVPVAHGRAAAVAHQLQAQALRA